jgi:DNA-binding CsgD family transcriptional regulator
MDNGARGLAALENVLDTLGFPALIADPRGRILHSTPALRELLERDAEPERLETAIVEMAEECNGAPRPQSNGGIIARRDVEAGNGIYEIRCMHYRLEADDPSPVCLVSVERTAAMRRSPQELKDQFALTPAELRVALLLRRGLPNADIARHLSVTEYTARRHTERVLRKLKVRSRSEVAERLMA